MYPVGLQRKDAANQEEEKALSRTQLVLSLVELGASQRGVGRQDALDQGLADYSPQAKSGLLSVFQNKNLWAHSHIYLFMFCVGWGWIGDSRKKKEGTTKLLSP